MDHSQHRIQHFVAFLCFIASGFAGLEYEVTWIRQATLLLGSTTFAVSAVLATFFSGLATGSYLFSRISVRTNRPLRMFAQIEFGIGLLAFASPPVFGFSDNLFGIVYRAIGEQIGMGAL